MPAISIFSGPITNLLLILCVLITIISCANEKNEKMKKMERKRRRRKALMISKFVLLLVVFKCHHGSEAVNGSLVDTCTSF